MNLRLKKGIVALGAAVFMGTVAFTSQAATYTYLISGDYADAGVWGSANINSAAFSYGGGLVGQYKDAAKGTFILKRTDTSFLHKKTYVDKTLSSKSKTVSQRTKSAGKYDKKGLRLTVKLNGESKRTAVIRYK